MVLEVCQEIIFNKSILEFIGVKVKTPITVYYDNMCTIFFPYNSKTGGRTNHIDVKYHYVKDFVRDQVIQIIFVRLDNNHSDVFMKNTVQKTYEVQSGNFMEMIKYSCGRGLGKKRSMRIMREITNSLT